MADAARDSQNPDIRTRPIFACGETSYTLREVLAAADRYELSAPLWTWLADALTCESYADEEGFEADPDRLQDALDEFRYRRRLVTIEDTERWLTDWQLTEDELIGTLAREAWRDRFAADLASIRNAYAPRPESVDEALWPALVVFDHLTPMATALARRVVAPMLLSAASGDRRHGKPAPGRPATADEWQAELERLDAAYGDLLGVVLTEHALTAALVSRRLDLTWLRLRTARFATADAAREARWCMTVDGEPFEEATGRGATLREDRELFIEDAGDSLAPFLVSAVAGDEVLLEDTLDQTGGALLVQVEARTPPRLDHPAVRARLEASIVDRCFGPAIGERIRWLVPAGESR